MNIQPYFPEPIEVPDNVAKARYKDVLKFIKKVSIYYYFSFIASYLLGRLLQPYLSFKMAMTLLISNLVILSLTRTWFRNQYGNFISILLLLPTLTFLGSTLILLNNQGNPTWILGLTASVAFLYSLISGRDFNFFGQFFISNFIVILIIVILTVFNQMTFEDAYKANGYAFFYLIYYVYDFTCLLKRRTQTEIFAAVADLYRDVFNGCTYIVRVVQHWRKFKL